jgi:hypothetical protein
MGRPQHGNFVPHAVQPVVAEVVEQQGQQPAGQAEPEGVMAPQRRVVGHGGVDAQRQQLGEDGAGLAQHAQVQRGDGIGQRVGVAPAPAADGPFHGHQCKEHREGQNNDLAG